MYAYPMQLLWTHWKKQPNAFTDLSYHINHRIWRGHVLKNTTVVLRVDDTEVQASAASGPHERSNRRIAVLVVQDGYRFVQVDVRKNDVAAEVFQHGSNVSSDVLKCKSG